MIIMIIQNYSIKYKFVSKQVLLEICYKLRIEGNKYCRINNPKSNAFQSIKPKLKKSQDKHCTRNKKHHTPNNPWCTTSSKHHIQVLLQTPTTFTLWFNWFSRVLSCSLCPPFRTIYKTRSAGQDSIHFFCWAAGKTLCFKIRTPDSRSFLLHTGGRVRTLLQLVSSFVHHF